MDSEDSTKDGKGEANPIFVVTHGLVLEIAKTRYKISLLEDLLISRGLTSKEELLSLYDKTLKEKLPEFFSKTEETIQHQKVKLIFKENGDIFISGIY